MTAQTGTQAHRIPLTRERVLQTAIRLADHGGGVQSLSMRNLARELGVRAMALYYHFANKDDLIDGMVDLVFSEIELPVGGPDWRTAMRRRAISVHDVLLRHRWAIGLMEARRNPGPANLRHHDAVLGSLRAAGFDIVMAAHAYSVLDSYVYGHALTRMTLPFESSEEVSDVATAILQRFPADAYPSLVEMIDYALKPGYDYRDEFEYGLDVVLDGLDRVEGMSSLG